jgi:glycosyltransferase involved in cell wall biosynthesis
MVGRFDIGLMPLIDGPWERAKCGYKLIQYMAAGVVPIGARIGENEVIIQDGVNGYLASEPEEWIKKLLILCGNHQLRSAVGARARETVLAKYDVRIAADAVHEVFTQVVNRQTRSA